MIPKPLLISFGIEHFFLLKNQNQIPTPEHWKSTTANRANQRGQNGQFRT